MDSKTQRKQALTYDDVANLCDTLDELNIKVTQQLLSNILQRGSTTTINKHLNEWKESRASKGAKLSKAIIRNIEAEIDSMVQKENRSLNSKIIALQEELDKTNTKSKSLEYSNTNLREENEQLQNTIESKNNEIEAEKLLLSQAEAKLKIALEQQQKTELEIALLKNTNSTNSSTIETLKAENKELSIKAEDKVQDIIKLQNEVSKANAKSESLVSNIANLEKDKETLKNTIEGEKNLLIIEKRQSSEDSKKLKTALVQQQKQELKIASLENTNSNNTSIIKDLKIEKKELAKKIDVKTKENTKLQVDLAKANMAKQK